MRYNSPRILGVIDGSKDIIDEDVISYDTEWGNMFSLPKHWVIKALNESLKVCSESMTTTIPYHERSRPNDLISFSFRQIRKKLCAKSTYSKNDHESSNIFSDEFFDSCLKSRLEFLASSPISKTKSDKEVTSLPDRITKILSDNTYR